MERNSSQTIMLMKKILDYDFSPVNKMKFTQECQVNILDYFNLEKLDVKNTMNTEKLKILNNNQLINSGNRDKLLEEIIKGEKFLLGYYDEHCNDPDYKLI